MGSNNNSRNGCNWHMENESIIEVQLSGIKEDVTKLQEDHDKTKSVKINLTLKLKNFR